jgi:hypothetical protein
LQGLDVFNKGPCRARTPICISGLDKDFFALCLSLTLRRILQ